MSVSRIYLVGFMGSGKTTVGRRLAKKLGWKFIDLDEEIERRERRSVADIFHQNGEAYFRQLERHLLKQVSSSKHPIDNSSNLKPSGKPRACGDHRFDGLA